MLSRLVTASLQDSCYSLPWLWVLPDLQFWKAPWPWESLLSRNPVLCPLFWVKSPLSESTQWPRVTWSLLHLLGLVDLTAHLFPRESSCPGSFSTALPLSDSGMSQHAVQHGLWIVTCDWKNIRTGRNLTDHLVNCSSTFYLNHTSEGKTQIAVGVCSL